MNENLKIELDELRLNQNEFTTSDLQGCSDAIAHKYGVSEEECLRYIYHNNQGVRE